MKLRYRTILGILLALAVLLLIFSKPLAHFLTEIWWFEAIGFVNVFWTELGWQIGIALVILVTYGLFLLANYRLAHHNTRQHSFQFFDDSLVGVLSDRAIHSIAIMLIGLVSLVIAGSQTAVWETALKFFQSQPVGQVDPVFQRDLAFYLFQLPFYEWLYGLLLFLIGISIAVVVAVYLSKGVLEYDRSGKVQISRSAKAHLSGLLGLLLIVLGWQLWLAQYQLLYESRSAVFGIGYTDRFARLFAFRITSLLTVAFGIFCLLAVRRRGFAAELKGLTVLIILSVILRGGYPWFVQQFLVAPNELAKEKPYLAHNIRLTQAAYNLQNVQQEKYQATANLTRQSLQNNQSTIQNIRLWDYRPLLSTFRQLQEIRLYYKFSDVDVDRYRFNDNYQQVMLSAREMVHEQLPIEAQTWVNKRLKYTHGHGFVMAPVNQLTSDGLPEFYVKNIPPTANVNLSIQQPAIYYGEESKNYIFTGMTTDEFDYPLGNTNASTRYSGKGGVSIGSIWRRLLYAYDLNSLQILISNYFAPTSRIHYYRQVRERIQHLAPFLQLDGDPYLVVANGRLQWIVDAYTVSDHYPYSQPVQLSKNVETVLQQDSLRSLIDHRLNYIRNAVKIVVDAYDGSIQLYAMDETEPILATYRRAFPGLFKSLEQLPGAIHEHFRYPHDLFKIQMQMYLTYHMSDPEVFYNREDQWRFPEQIYEDSPVLLDPYYVIMRLPGESEPGFLMIQPFTPSNKENMIAWMAARSNGKDYGKLLLYEFPKQSLVYGPRQIESRIDQDPQISQQFTLWNQSGSKVIRGDLLVIPIEQSLLYVEPIYLRAEQSALPQMKRVVVAYDKSVVMENTLEEALDRIFGKSGSDEAKVPEQVSRSGKVPLSPQKTQLAQSALQVYRKAQEALRQGNWAEYGRYHQELEKLLQQLGKP